ncbi:UDP-N-acetyl-D-galactosamine dehydrogenase [Priestia filamentosa]|uniref:UDP-N-acetyl-D-galactosamine dehydrogenase n=1 Tax=Priestia filamentosa TaxID=1402861 RepID=A0A0H4KLI7_9BACI|nr:nucleotide sugar dehydrogenase [Priestia filamentosa]AKO93706.1 UDP-N-acetyl-D-galactosamine dehydrogenase [Priestia filamentosa]
MYNEIKNKREKIAVIGLGYVGLPLAIEFAKKFEVVGFDVNEEKLEKYLNGIDVTNEVGNEAIKSSNLVFTNDPNELKRCKFHIISVPTPINSDKTPNLRPVIEASKTVGKSLTKDSIVVYESTVYPGTTEEVCIPILEEESGLTFGIDFKVGYSPERINPGDKVNTLTKIVKVVSGSDEETLEIVADVYGSIIEAGVHKAPNIKVAEASKVIENSQRDINIAFMNELSMIFNRMGIDTKAVLEASGTKWNFLNFTPGLVGGHCIGVDPYYFIYKAEQLGYHSQIVLSGRKINDDMGKYIAENTVKKLIQADKSVKGSKVAVYGITFKENTVDSRNTKVIDIIRELEEYGIQVKVVDPVADPTEVWNEYQIKLSQIEEIKDIDATILAVPHNEFLSISLMELKETYKLPEMSIGEKSSIAVGSLTSELLETSNVLIDVKGMFERKEAEELGYLYWRL